MSLDTEEPGTGSRAPSTGAGDLKPKTGIDVVAYLKLFRFPLVFTAIADSATGYLLSGKTDARVLGFLALCSAGLYFFGMAMNDVADHRRDRELAPTRPIPSGRISLRGAIIAALLCALGSLVALLALPGASLLHRVLCWSTALLAILAYDFFLKVPPTMGLVRAANFAIGLISGWGPLETGDLPWLSIILLPTFVYVTGLTFVSTLEDGVVRRGKLWIGATLMIGAVCASINWLGIVFALLSNSNPGDGGVRSPSLSDALTNLAFYLRDVYSPWSRSLVAVLPLIGWIGYRAWKARDKKGVMLLVRDGIGGLILLDVSLLLNLPSGAAAIGVAALLIPAVLSVMVFKKLA